MVFFFKQKTAFEVRISDWSSDVCSSDLPRRGARAVAGLPVGDHQCDGIVDVRLGAAALESPPQADPEAGRHEHPAGGGPGRLASAQHEQGRSEEHTSELQSLMRISYAVFCLKKKKKDKHAHEDIT